ncbi:MAG: hypothetical protein J6B85_06645 [Lachnospiraceae bacterium]|nr:hypothetical protein [Lachnospiraceae bacterium]
MDKNITFTYNYSAPENKEVQEIRKKYLPKQESKLEELKRLDRDVQLAGTTEGLIVGIGGCLVFGVGMCLAMHIIGNSFLLGVLADIIGTAVMIAAFPLYRHISEKTKERLVPRILQLVNELNCE